MLGRNPSVGCRRRSGTPTPMWGRRTAGRNFEARAAKHALSVAVQARRADRAAEAAPPFPSGPAPSEALALRARIEQ